MSKLFYDNKGNLKGYELDLNEDFKSTGTEDLDAGFRLLKDPFATILVYGLIPATILGTAYSFFHIGFVQAIISFFVMGILDAILFPIIIRNSRAAYQFSEEPVIFLSYHVSWALFFGFIVNLGFQLFSSPSFLSDKTIEAFLIALIGFLLIQKLCCHFRRSYDPR